MSPPSPPSSSPSGSSASPSAAPDHVLREASAADVPALVALVNQAFAVEAFFVEGDRTDAAEVGALLASGGFLIAEPPPGGPPLGCIYLEPRGDRAYFGMLSIAPAAQRRGLGRTLIAAAEDRARAAGAGWMDIRIVDLRTELPPYYGALGYVARGTEPYPEGEVVKRACHFVVMSKPLRPAPGSPSPGGG